MKTNDISLYALNTLFLGPEETSINLEALNVLDCLVSIILTLERRLTTDSLADSSKLDTISRTSWKQEGIKSLHYYECRLCVKTVVMLPPLQTYHAMAMIVSGLELWVISATALGIGESTHIDMCLKLRKFSYHARQLASWTT